MIEVLVFACAAAMVVCGAVAVIASRHPVHSALGLVLTLFGIAVMFVSQEAHFLAAAQVIVYAGAIVVLFLFVIMLLGVDRVERIDIEPIKVQRPLAAIAATALAGLLIAAIVAGRDTVTASPGEGLPGVRPGLDNHDGNIRAVARDLFGDKVFAFELTSVLLIIAVVGTVLLTRRAKGVDAEIDAEVDAEVDAETVAGASPRGGAGASSGSITGGAS